MTLIIAEGAAECRADTLVRRPSNGTFSSHSAYHNLNLTPEVRNVHIPTVVCGFRTVLANGPARTRPLPDRMDPVAAVSHRRHRSGRRIRIPTRSIHVPGQTTSHPRKTIEIENHPRLLVLIFLTQET